MKHEQSSKRGGIAAAKGRLYLGLGRYLVPIPPCLMRRGAADSARHADKGLARLSPEHHLVRDFVVTEIPRKAASLPVEYIAERLGLPVGRVRAIVDELERGKVFLFRNERGEVTWAYPVTAEPTPHRVTFSTGEQIYAAWAIDALALPFVQGKLTKRQLSFMIMTECENSGDPIEIAIDSDLGYRVADEQGGMRVFVPMVDVMTIDEPSIIESFWRKSVFFRSEEDARAYRRAHGGVKGLYLTLDHGVYLTRVIQGAIFAFSKRTWWGALFRRIRIKEI